MRSPKAVNRSHSRHVFSVNSARGKGEAAKRRQATKKKWQHSLLGLNPYATKAAIVFATFDLKVAEADRLNKFSNEQPAEKSSASDQMKAEKDLQKKIKKEQEAIKKQQKQERKKIADAARKEEEEKLAKSNVAPHLTKESENKNSITTSEPFSEECVKELSKRSSKKNKKNKKKLESDSTLVNEEVIVARNIEPTETPKNTPVDTPAEIPTTPAEETHSKRKAKKRKSESSGGSPEHKTEKHNEEYDFDVEKVPMVIEEVNIEEQQHNQTTPSVPDPIDSVVNANAKQVVSETKTENALISEYVPIEEQQHDPTAQSIPAQTDNVNDANINVQEVVSENVAIPDKPVAVEEQQHNPAISFLSEHIDSIDTTTVNVEEVVAETGIVNRSVSEESIVEQQEPEHTTSSFDNVVSIVAAPVNVDNIVSKAGTEKGSVLEEPARVENVDAVNNKTDDEFEFVEHEEVEIVTPSSSEAIAQIEKIAVEIDASANETPMVCSSFNKSKKNKKNKKTSHTDLASAVHTVSIAPVPEEHSSVEDTPEPAHTIIDEVDRISNRVSEPEYSSVIPDNKEAVNNLNQVISTTKDELDEIAQDENASKTTAPIQVNEVTSTETDSDGQKIRREHISAAVELDSVTNPTHFAQNVQKLVNSTLSASDFNLNDPNVKMTVQAQLLKITEKEKKSTVIYEHKPITLAYERQRTVFERPSRERVYKLLNRDIVFCSSMIDVYGEDYESMAKDKKNVYRETARSIQRKIRIFKESPHYSVYLEAKAQGKDVSELLTEETL